MTTAADNPAAVAASRLAEARRGLDDLRRRIADEEAKRNLAAQQRTALLEEVSAMVGYPVPSLEHLDGLINDLVREGAALVERIDAGIQSVRQSMPEGA